MSRPAVFLDRDGTMIEELGYLTPSSTLTVYPWTIDAIRLFNRAGFAVVAVTNQGGIARGLYTREFVDATHDGLARRFAGAGARVDGWYYCPHHHEAILDEFRAKCACRKPEPGMLQDAARDLDLDLPRSWTIGDMWRDIEMAHRSGGKSVLVRTGHGRSQERTWRQDVARPTAICDNLMAAAAEIFGHH